MPALFGGGAAERTFLAVADRLQAVGRDAQRNQELLGSGGPAVTQSKVVFGGAALIAMSLDYDLQLRIRTQERRRLAREHHATSGANVRLVVDQSRRLSLLC